VDTTSILFLVAEDGGSGIFRRTVLSIKCYLPLIFPWNVKANTIIISDMKETEARVGMVIKIVTNTLKQMCGTIRGHIT
jgi:hypothetical protein